MKEVYKMIVLACAFRSDEGECLLENKPCDGCKGTPQFIDWEAFEDDTDGIRRAENG